MVTALTWYGPWPAYASLDEISCWHVHSVVSAPTWTPDILVHPLTSCCLYFPAANNTAVTVLYILFNTLILIFLLSAAPTSRDPIRSNFSGTVRVLRCFKQLCSGVPRNSVPNTECPGDLQVHDFCNNAYGFLTFLVWEKTSTGGERQPSIATRRKK